MCDSVKEVFSKTTNYLVDTFGSYVIPCRGVQIRVLHCGIHLNLAKFV